MAKLPVHELYVTSMAKDVCDHCVEPFEVVRGHWCPKAPAMYQPTGSTVWRDGRWSGERVYRCEMSKVRLVVDIRGHQRMYTAGVSLDVAPGTQDLNGWICYVLTPPHYLAVVSRALDRKGSAAEALMALFGLYSKDRPYAGMGDVRSWTRQYSSVTPTKRTET